MLRSLPRRAVSGRPARAQALAPPMESWRCFPRGVNLDKLTAKCYSSTGTRRALFKQHIQHWRKVRGSFFAPSEEVKQARETNTPIVGLETTIYTHGFPYPDNVQLALDLEQIVRDNGGVPATIGVLDGQIRVGMTTSELKRLASAAGDPETRKVSRRDIPYIVGMGLAGRKLNGGTTVAGTMHICASAGIKVFGTGGLGGVHRDGQNTMDVSADLTELGSTNVAVVSSGCKSFLDLPRTLEYLETQGVMVATFADGRHGEVDIPSFYSRESGIKSPMTVQNAKEAAAMIFASNYTTRSGLLFANPIPEKHSIPREEIDAAMNQAVQEAADQGFHGHLNTPFILARIKELTQGNSIPANRALIESNVRMATKVAVELAKFESNYGVPHDPSKSLQSNAYAPKSKEDSASMSDIHTYPHESESQGPANPEKLTYGLPYDSTKTPQSKAQSTKSKAKSVIKSDIHTLPCKSESGGTAEPERRSSDQREGIIVFGSVALDYSCDHAPQSSSKGAISSQAQAQAQVDESALGGYIPKTSNIATITESIGGVGHNVALAALRVTAQRVPRPWVSLRSFVGDDIAGTAILSGLAAEGLRGTHGHHVLTIRGQRTARYVTLNDTNKDLVLAAADMSIFSNSQDVYPSRPITKTRASWVVVDANWNPVLIQSLLYDLQALKKLQKKKWFGVAYEPVSVPKAGAIFFNATPELKLSSFPQHTVNLATPNQHELAAMHSAAKDNEFLESKQWWKTINALGIPSSGARDRFVQITNAKMTDEGIPLQTIQLLPYIPTILTKLGSEGVLLTTIMQPNDPRLTDPDAAPYILSRNTNGSKTIGGVYMRLFPAAEVVEDVVSVNGVGDTFLGVVIAGLSCGRKLDEELIGYAQKAAVMTLRSVESVSPELEKVDWFA